MRVSPRFVQGQFRPGFGAVGQLHVSALDLLAGVALLDVEIEADECEDEGYGFGLVVGVLGGVGVDDVLVDEGRGGVSEGVEG